MISLIIIFVHIFLMFKMFIRARRTVTTMKTLTTILYLLYTIFPTLYFIYLVQVCSTQPTNISSHIISCTIVYYWKKITLYLISIFKVMICSVVWSLFRSETYFICPFQYVEWTFFLKTTEQNEFILVQ